MTVGEASQSEVLPTRKTVSQFDQMLQRDLRMRAILWLYNVRDDGFDIHNRHALHTWYSGTTIINCIIGNSTNILWCVKASKFLTNIMHYATQELCVPDLATVEQAWND